MRYPATISSIYDDGPSAQPRVLIILNAKGDRLYRPKDGGYRRIPWQAVSVPCCLNLCIDGLQITKSRGSMEAAGNTTRVVYVCSVCSKSFGDIHSSCAKHVNGRGACKEKGAVVLPLPINFSRNDRNVGGRLGHQHEFQPGRLAAPGQADDSDMVASPARAPVSGIHTYLTFLSQLSYILISIILKMYPNYPTYLVIYPIYPLHAYVADKQPR